MVQFQTVLFTFGLSKVYRDVLTNVAKVHPGRGVTAGLPTKIKILQENVDAYN